MIRRIKVRRGTASDWSTINPILSEGEFGYSTNDGQLKVGNGSSPWNALRSLVASDRQLTVNGTANQITVNTPSQNLATNPSWILSLPQNIHTAAQPRFGTLGLGTNAPSDFGFDVLTGNTAGNRHLFTVNGGLRFQRRGDTSGWAFAYGVMTNDNLVAGGFGATGSNTQINYYFIGSDLNDTAFRMTPAGLLGLGLNLAATERLDVNGNVRIRSLATSVGDFVTANASGVFSRRTAAQTLNDIGALSVSSSNYTRSNAAAESAGDFNTQTVHSNVGSINAITNTPFGSGWYNFLNIRHRGGAADGNLYGTQIAVGMTSNRNRIAFRSQNNGDWDSWTELAPASGSANYVQNQDSANQTANFRITGVARANGGGLFSGATNLRGDVSIGTNSTGSQTRSLHLGYGLLDFYGWRITNINDAASTAAGNLLIQRGTTSTWINAVTLDNSGNVGINTIPTQRLHVSGNGLFTGWIHAGNIRIDANTFSSQNTNGNITFLLNGTGKVVYNAPTDNSLTSALFLNGSNEIHRRALGSMAFSNGGDYTGITSTDISNWNTAYGWGDFRITGFGTDTAIEYTSIGGSADNLPLLSGLYAANAISGDLPNNNSKFYSVVIKDGAGITSGGVDLQLAFSEYIGATGGPGSNFGLFLRDVHNGSSNGWKRFWDTTDFAMSQVENWDVAFSWGDHSAAGYLLSSSASTTYVALSGSYNNPAWLTGLAWSKITGVPTSFTPSAHNHTASDITSGTISYARLPFGASDVNNWNSAFTWGNHSTAGYLLSSAAATTYVALAGSYNNPSWITGLAWSKITGVPSSFTPSAHNHSASEITSGTLAYARLPFGLNDVNNWNTAVGWGNHAVAGYLTSSAAASSYVALAGSYSNPSWITALAWNKITGVPALGAPEEYVKVHLDVNNAVIPSRITPLINSTLYHIPGNAASNSGIYTPIIWDIESEDIGDRFDSGVITINPGEIWQITASIECFWAQQGTGSSWVPVYGQSPTQGISLDLVIVEVDVNSNEEIIAKQTTDGAYARYTDPPFFNEGERSLWMNTEVNHQYHNNTSSQSYLYIAARSWLPHNLGINPSPEVTRLTAKRLK